MIGRLTVSVALLTTALSPMTRAQEQPLLLPTRDVSIIYRLPGDSMGKSAPKMQATYTAGGDRIRYDFFRFTEAKQPFASWIYDRARDRQIAIKPESREYEIRPYPTGPTPGAFLSSDMGFKKQQSAAVAGQPCTNWTITSSNSKVNGAVACITDTGILLRLSSPDPKDSPQLQAEALSYATVSNQLFSPPSGFMRSRPAN